MSDEGKLYYDGEQADVVMQHVIVNPTHKVEVTLSTMDDGSRLVHAKCTNCNWWNDLV